MQRDPDPLYLGEGSGGREGAGKTGEWGAAELPESPILLEARNALPDVTDSTQGLLRGSEAETALLECSPGNQLRDLPKKEGRPGAEEKQTPQDTVLK